MKFPGVFIVLFLLVLFLGNSCSSPKEKTEKKADMVKLKEPLIKANQYLERSEDQQIDAYATRHQWLMNKSATGLRYQIYQHGNGATPEKGKIAVISFALGLLSGETCYSSAKQGNMEFELGKGRVINGLEEAIFLMRVGDKAKLIVPSHLAFGLPGDQKKIPPRASIVYDIEFLSLK
jgi:FKBP-type peptidyl-prolyl cis-trans isomerase FkpA